MPLEDICEPSITYSTSFSINTPKSCNNVIVINLIYPVLMLHSGDSVAALPVLLLPSTLYLQGSHLTNYILPPSASPHFALHTDKYPPVY